MGYVTPQQIAAAKEMDLLTYLENYEREELVHAGGKTYSTRSHDSLKISNGKWIWWSRGIGGRSALDYLIKVKGYHFTDAVEAILHKTGNNFPVVRREAPRQEEKTPFLLPRKNETSEMVRAYLAGRGIDESLIEHCLGTGQIYESKGYHNAVFTGKDGSGKIRYASYRATNGRRIMGEVAGSDKSFSFRLVEEKSDCLHVFESAIDLLSFVTLAKMDGKRYDGTNYLSLSGVYAARQDGTYKLPVSLEYFLRANRNIRNICLRLDNDRAGHAAAGQIEKILKPEYRVFVLPPSKGKDQNDQLMARKGLQGNAGREMEGNYGR